MDTHSDEIWGAGPVVAEHVDRNAARVQNYCVTAAAVGLLRAELSNYDRDKIWLQSFDFIWFMGQDRAHDDIWLQGQMWGKLQPLKSMLKWAVGDHVDAMNIVFRWQWYALLDSKHKAANLKALQNWKKLLLKQNTGLLMITNSEATSIFGLLLQRGWWYTCHAR